MRRLVLCHLLLFVLCGCDDDGPAADLAVADLSVVATQDLTMPAPLSQCGFPGDTGNPLGVGQFCTNQGPDCGGNTKAKLCSALVNPATPTPDDSYFCTFLCTATDPPGTCGDNARCLCRTDGCICIHTRCIPNDAGT